RGLKAARIYGDSCLRASLPTILSTEHQARIDPAESKAVAQDELGIGHFALTGQIGQITGRVGLFQIDSRREPVVLAGQGTDGGLKGTARAQCVAVIPLGAADRNLAGVVAEDLADGSALGWIIERSGGSVGVDVPDVTGVDSSFGQRQPHGPS